MRLLMILFISLIGSYASAHNAPTGWAYPAACCSGVDCREVKSSSIKELPQGYEIMQTGELVKFHDTRLKSSPDGEYHWCSAGGTDQGRTICLFVPPSSY